MSFFLRIINIYINRYNTLLFSHSFIKSKGKTFTFIKTEANDLPKGSHTGPTPCSHPIAHH